MQAKSKGWRIRLETEGAVEVGVLARSRPNIRAHRVGLVDFPAKYLLLHKLGKLAHRDKPSDRVVLNVLPGEARILVDALESLVTHREPTERVRSELVSSVREVLVPTGPTDQNYTQQR